MAAEPFAVPPAFDPRLPEYDPYVVEAYFHSDRIQTAEEFVAWRDQFFPNQSRCDACFFRQLDCVMSDEGNGCINCVSFGRECVFTNIPPNQPSPSDPSNSNAAPNVEPAVDRQDRGKGVEILSCANCTLWGCGDCDMRLGFKYGCTACRKLDIGCEFLEEGMQPQILEPRPDGLLAPLCCDNCLNPPGNIHSCSWRLIGKDPSTACDQCMGAGIVCTYMGILQQNMPDILTHFSRTQHFNSSRPDHLKEHFANPRPSAGAPRTDGVGAESPSFTPSQSRSPSSPASVGVPAPFNLDGVFGDPLNQLVHQDLSVFSGFVDNGIPNEVLNQLQASPQGSLDFTGLPAVGAPGGSNDQPNQPNQPSPGAEGGPAPSPSQALVPAPGPSGAAGPNPGPDVNQAVNVDPVRNPVLTGKTRPCRLCASYGPGAYNFRRCNWLIVGDLNNPGPGSSQQGCTVCKTYGLVCVVEDGIALPPTLDAALVRRPAFATCNPCKAADTICDRQRPCDFCVIRGTPDQCAGGKTTRGTFTRGVGYGVELYTYMSVMGGGLLGVNDREKFQMIYNQPLDIHLRYIQWTEGGPLPLPPGFRPTARTPLRPDVQVRALPFPLPVPPDPAPPTPPAQAGAPQPVAEQPGVEQPDVQQPAAQQPGVQQPGVQQPAAQQPAIQPPAIQQPAIQQPVIQQPAIQQPVIQQPAIQQPGIQQAAAPQLPMNFDILNFGEQAPPQDLLLHYQTYQMVWNTAREVANKGQVIDLYALRENLREALFAGIPVYQSAAAHPYLDPAEKLPVTQPVRIPPGTDENEVALLGQGARMIFNIGDFQIPSSPPPTNRLFDIQGVNNLLGGLNWPQGHPEYADLSLISAQPPNHPDPLSNPAFSTVPIFTLFDQAAQPELLCSELKPGKHICLGATHRSCEDLSHDAANPVAVCDPCNEASRARFEKSLAASILSMRAYACSLCAITESANPANYAGKRLNVWGLLPDALADFDEFSSRNRGPPLRLTGCHCATKLLDRRLCTPHRLAHYLEMRAKVRMMRDFVMATLGRMVCPFCHVRAGADAYNFADEQGVEFPVHAYACMGCYGIVVLDAPTHAAGLMDAARIMGDDAQPAQV